MENMIKDFLRGSIKNTLADYDFVAFFDEFKPVLHQKLTEHGLTTLEEYTVYMEDIETLSDENLEQFTIQTDYVYFGTEEKNKMVAEIAIEFNISEKESSAIVTAAIDWIGATLVLYKAGKNRVKKRKNK